MGARVQGCAGCLESARTYAEDTDSVFCARREARYRCGHLTLLRGPDEGSVELNMMLLDRRGRFGIFPREVDLL